jgi:hypothetical protein
MSEPLDEDTPPGSSRAPWERPTLTELGDVKDLVRAAGKQSGNADSDGGNPRKPPLLG